MKITALEGQKISELSMIEVAHALLEQNGKEMQFSEIIRAIQDYLEKSDDEIKASISRFYTEINTDGSFIPLGNNIWALRSWYAIDEIDEEVIALDEIEDEEEEKPAKKRKKVNAFGIEDEIDPEEGTKETTEEDMSYDTQAEDEDKDDVAAYDAELAEVELDNVDEEVDIDVEDDEDDSDDTDED